MKFLRIHPIFPLALLVVLLGLLSGCGSNTPVGTQPSGPQPDSVKITLLLVTTAKGSPAPMVTDHNLSQVHELFQAMETLPQMPQQIGCTADLGPHYQLDFSQGGRELASALARHDGCGPVTIKGESGDREADQAFWALLLQDISASTPVPSLTSLAIARAQAGLHPMLTARTTDPATAQRVYNAILALPLETHSSCYDQSPAYDLAFQTASQTIPATISQTCQTITLTSSLDTLTSTYTLTPGFQQLFAQVINNLTFAPAQPEALSRSVMVHNGATTTGKVLNASLMQQLYQGIFTLTSAPIPPNCPSGEDKIKGTVSLYDFTFTQWGLPIMNLSVYDASCKMISPSFGLAQNTTLVGTASFWQLVYQAAKA